MNSQQALKKLIDYTRGETPVDLFRIIQQDIYKLEELEEENKVLLVNKNVAQGVAIKLKEENNKLKKALNKAIEKCMKFDKCPPITCIELYNDNDNDNVCKECWKKYLLKEVLDND